MLFAKAHQHCTGGQHEAGLKHICAHFSSSATGALALRHVQPCSDVTASSWRRKQHTELQLGQELLASGWSMVLRHGSQR